MRGGVVKNPTPPYFLPSDKPHPTIDERREKSYCGIVSFSPRTPLLNDLSLTPPVAHPHQRRCWVSVCEQVDYEREFGSAVHRRAETLPNGRLTTIISSTAFIDRLSRFPLTKSRFSHRSGLTSDCQRTVVESFPALWASMQFALTTAVYQINRLKTQKRIA